ncbi:hypothetical protein [Priestia aryabhattai]|uniref:hypothetical protein n=1 Tax=Priestia aryabhattai TaxID=412384 RepID=UPI002E212D26|nr:hypothetical protein [Priestia aryabhattai]
MRVNNISLKNLSDIENLPISTFGGTFATTSVTATNFYWETYIDHVTELAIFKVRENYLVPVKHDIPTIFSTPGYATTGTGIFEMSLMDLPINDSYVTIMKVSATGIPKNDYVKSVTWVKK